MGRFSHVCSPDRVGTYDRLGSGGSHKKARGYDDATLAEDLEGVMSTLDLHDATLVGFSMRGGEVARHGTEFEFNAALADFLAN